jgi:hypothetical protein
VTIAWFYLKRDGKGQKHYVLSAKALKTSTITWWGNRRWQIEGWFKTAKHRFGLHRFGQQTLTGLFCLGLLICWHIGHMSPVSLQRH